MGIIHGIFFIGGQAFCNPNTILPIFLNHFTNSKTLIGLSSTLMGSLGGIGSVFPQLFVASKLENKIYKKPLLKFAITIRALSWGFLALTTYVFSNTYPSLTIFFLFFILILFTFMGGIAAVPFYDIWGKSLPSYLRGRFFAYRQLLGGILAIFPLIGGVIVQQISYKILFFITGTLMLFGFILSFGLKESRSIKIDKSYI